MKLYEKISILRKRHGMSQEELADRLDVSRQSVYKWEQGVSYPEIEKLKKLSQIFNVSIDALLNDDADISAPVANVATAPSYRHVFVSKNDLEYWHSDFDHGVSPKSTKRKFKKSDEYFAQCKSEMENVLSSRNYDCIMTPQLDLNVRFFADEKQNICGFFYDGAEQCVIPIENIIDVSLTDDGNNLDYNSRMTGIGLGFGGVRGIGVSSTPVANMAKPRHYILSISYFTHDGKTDSYSITFFTYRAYPTYLTKSVEQDNMLRNRLSDMTRIYVTEIRDKIIALKAKGELIRNGSVQVTDIDVEELSKCYKEAKKAADDKRAELEASIKKGNFKRRIINGAIIAGVAIATVIFLIYLFQSCPSSCTFNSCTVFW